MSREIHAPPRGGLLRGADALENSGRPHLRRRHGKALQDPAPRIDRRAGRDPGFEAMLKKFMRQSEERQVDFKRSVENKRK